MSTGTRRVAPLHIRSQDLGAAAGRVATGSGMPAFPLDLVQPQATIAKRGAWRERDLRRALAVARCAKLRNYRVEIAPDGTISIVVGSQ